MVNLKLKFKERKVMKLAREKEFVKFPFHEERKIECAKKEVEKVEDLMTDIIDTYEKDGEREKGMYFAELVTREILKDFEEEKRKFNFNIKQNETVVFTGEDNVKRSNYKSIMLNKQEVIKFGDFEMDSKKRFNINFEELSFLKRVTNNKNSVFY